VIIVDISTNRTLKNKGYYIPDAFKKIYVQCRRTCKGRAETRNGKKLLKITTVDCNTRLFISMVL